MRVSSFFAGIGGFDLGFERAGMNVVFQCELDPFCQQIPLRAQTGGHQGGHSDRPILCDEKLDMDRVGEADGVSSRMDGRRGRLIGNAVVPAIGEWIGTRILEIEIEIENKTSDR
jgi:site-specific DNA-cytosine methylase